MAAACVGGILTVSFCHELLLGVLALRELDGACLKKLWVCWSEIHLSYYGSSVVGSNFISLLAAWIAIALSILYYGTLVVVQ